MIKQYLWIFDLFALFLCSFFAAKLTNVYIGTLIATPVPANAPAVEKRVAEAPKTPPPYSDYKVILDRNIFDSEESKPAGGESTTTQNQMVVNTGEPVKTSLAIQVVGVLVVGAGKDDRSSATVSSSGKVDTYAVGTEDGFSPNTKLTRVTPERIEFLNQGRMEYALFEEETAFNIFGPPPTSETAQASPVAVATPTTPAETVKKEGEGQFVIDQNEVQNALSNMERLYTEIRAVPNFAGGKVSGMKILSVKQGSLFDKLGLQRGDILEKINGMELDVKKGFEIFNQLKTERHLVVDLQRQGAKKSFEYDIR